MRKLLVSVGIFVLSALATPASVNAATELLRTMHGHLEATRPAECPSRWCACYMNIVLAQLGYPPSGSNRAKDFASYGVPAEPAAIGSIMVMKNHVGVVAGMCGTNSVYLISGNYSRKVTYGCVAVNRAIAWREAIK